MTEPRTYTTEEARLLLGFQKRKDVHYLAKRWPNALIRVRPGKPVNNKGRLPTLWDADKLDEFVKWRNARKEFKHANPD